MNKEDGPAIDLDAIDRAVWPSGDLSIASSTREPAVDSGNLVTESAQGENSALVF